MLSEEFSKFDENLIQKFEHDWLEDNPQSIVEYLPRPDHSRYQGTLEELVHIDLEFRWKAYYERNDANADPPRIESYLSRFPELNEVKLGLIQGEFDLAYRYGESASVDEYVKRFGDTVEDQKLEPILLSQLSEIRKFDKVGPGTTIDHYEILTEQGRGGFGAVWRAMDSKLGRRIAVKQLGQRLAADSESRRRFISEARVTARLEHPGIVPVYDIGGTQDEHAYYTMRLIEGRTMAEAIEELHLLSPESDEFQLLRKRLLDSFVAVCQTMQYAHSQGVIHRDLKPQNIIVGNYGETILLDWGLASVSAVESPDRSRSSESETSLNQDPQVLSRAESLQTLEGKILGTPAYMPPEQARGDLESISIASDIYSLGATLYHLLTGRIPFTDRSIRKLLDRVKDTDIQTATMANPNCEPALSAIAMHAMSNRPEERYSDVAALMDDVDKFLADQPISVYRDPLSASAARWIRKNPTTAASILLTLIFVFLASTAGIFAYNAWKVREEKRVASIQVAAERAEAEALSQIKNGQFDAAAKLLAQSKSMVEQEVSLSSFADSIESKRDRTQRIVNFYQFSKQGQEEAFNDKVHRAAIYCQAALNELGVLQKSDWWNHLPDHDLTDLQKEQLKTEAYRITTLLASMRLAETAQSSASLAVLFNKDSLPAQDTSDGLFRAAAYAANTANRYKYSRAMRLIEDIGRSVEQNKLLVDVNNLSPATSIDSAIMGSILDNNLPNQGPIRDRAKTLLGPNPNAIAKQWLDDAIKYNPDWYWLPVFMGHSQIRLSKNEPEQAEESIRTFSHAVGIRPDYWVGYQYRAGASVRAALLEKNRRRKRELLNAAAGDIQRAIDLSPYEPEIFWTNALILQARGSAPHQVANSFLKGFELILSELDVKKGHFAAVVEKFQNLALEFVDLQRKEGENSLELALLELVVLTWQEQIDSALEKWKKFETQYSSDPTYSALGRFIKNKAEQETSQPIQFSNDSPYAWQFAISNYEHFLRQKNAQAALASIEVAYQVAKSKRQKSESLILLAQAQINLDLFDDALNSIKSAVKMDRAVNLESIFTMAKKSEDKQLIDLIGTLSISNKPVIGDEKVATIFNPAVLNNSFELGLTYHWTPFARRNTSLTWNNFGQSSTVAEISDAESKAGAKSLKISLNSPQDEKSFGQITQKIPVSTNVQYEISLWVKAKSIDKNSLVFGVANKRIKELKTAFNVDGGTYDWKQFSGVFEASEDLMELVIRTTGSGTVWVDDIQIHAVR